MPEAVPLARQVAAQQGDRLRVLVVGAGMAGVTLARLLREQGLHPVVAERARAGTGHGYMLGMLPFVDPVVRRLGVEPDYLGRSVGMRRYVVRGRGGRHLRTYRLDAAVEPFGHYRGIERGTLLELLAGERLPVAFDTVAERFEGSGPVVVDLLEHGTRRTLTVDAVIGADGVHSGVRDLLLRPDEIGRVDTGWGGWVAWSPSDDDPHVYEEVWGDGFFLGRYPVAGRTGVFLGAPTRRTAQGPTRLAARVRSELRIAGPRAAAALDAVEDAADAHRWDFADTRSGRWTSGPVALVGDAAAAFLPTAGVGAAMAVESAAALADRLDGVRPDALAAALRAYERSQRPRVESAQDASRRLARAMFLSGPAVTTARDVATRLVTLRSALRPVLRLLADRPGRRES